MTQTDQSAGRLDDRDRAGRLFRRQPGYCRRPPAIAPRRPWRPCWPTWNAGGTDWSIGRLRPGGGRHPRGLRGLVGVSADRWRSVADIGLVANIRRPACRAEVVIMTNDFTSIVYPFLVADRLAVRCVSLAAGGGRADGTRLVVFAGQSSTGEVADPTRSSRRSGAARRHWLISPGCRCAAGGRESLRRDRLPPTSGCALSRSGVHLVGGVRAGCVRWLRAGTPARTLDELWRGPEPGRGRPSLRPSPAWRLRRRRPAIELFAAADIGAVWEHACGLATRLRVSASRVAPGVTADQTAAKKRLTAWLRVAGRAGRGAPPSTSGTPRPTWRLCSWRSPEQPTRPARLRDKIAALGAGDLASALEGRPRGSSVPFELGRGLSTGLGISTGRTTR